MKLENFLKKEIGIKYEIHGATWLEIANSFLRLENPFLFYMEAKEEFHPDAHEAIFKKIFNTKKKYTKEFLDDYPEIIKTA